MRKLTNVPIWLKRTLAALAVAGAVGGAAATPALADDWHHDRDWNRDRHEWAEHHRARYVERRVIYAPPPRVVYAPPPAVIYEPPPRIVYARPPVVYQPAPSLSIVLPLHF